MKPGATAILLLGLLIFPALAGAALAQQATPPAPAPQAGNERQPTAAEVQTLFDAMVVVQAQKALGLSDTQYPQFVGRLKALQDARRRSVRERNQLLQQMQRLTNLQNGAGNDSHLRALLRSFNDLQDRAAADVRKAYDGVDQVLDVRQQARFRVFEEQVERRKFDFLLRARRRAGTRPEPASAR